MKECIHAILKEKLADAQYVPEEVPQLTKSLSEIIKDRLKGKEVCGESRFFSHFKLYFSNFKMCPLPFINLLFPPLFLKPVPSLSND